MKKITNYILICTCALGFSSCVNTFLDLEPLDAKTDVIYFKTPEHFREYANGLYGQLLGWQSSYGSIFDHMDAASDLSTCFRYSYGVGTGVMGVPNDDSRWGNCYGNIRATNHMFERAVSSYTGIKGQKTMRTRYLMEDIPYSLVALQTMGQVAGGPTPCISAVITVARAIIPEMDEGRTRKNLGLEGVDKVVFEAMCREG